MDNTWYSTLETRIFDRIKKETQTKLKTKYPTIFYTSSGQNRGEPVFPTVYIHELSGYEMGQDLAGEDINAVMENIQVEVITNTNQLDAKKIMAEIVDSIKGMRFHVQAMPSFDNGTTYYRQICRCRRVIGNGEEL